MLEGLRELPEEELAGYCRKMGLAMNADDLREVVKYFRSEGRDPFETELRILDTYWSDHCRHTTFTTELEDIQVEDSFIKGNRGHAEPLHEDTQGTGTRKQGPEPHGYGHCGRTLPQVEGTA